MRIGILSDTHDELERTRFAVELLRTHRATALIHCGDLKSPAIVKICAEIPLGFVLGNHDADNVPYLKEAAGEVGAICLGWSGRVELAGKTIAVAHGHMTYDIRHVMNPRPHYLLTGHSHIASDNYDGLVRRINPGALQEADQFSVALLDLESDELQFLEIPSLSGAA